MENHQDILPSTRNGRNGFWRKSEGITPLVVFRILFGLVVAFGALRFMVEGWIETLLVEPKFFFSFWGFEWIPRPDRVSAYALYGVITASAVSVSLGYRYRWSVAILFLSFTYAELLDATNYLNHYYLVILLTVLLFFIPAHRAFSLDVLVGRVSELVKVPKLYRYLLMFQLAIVYTFAGLAKVNADWLLEAMPMAIWLPERAHYPLVGELLRQPWVAYAFSWTGCLYDLTIIGWLLWRPSRKWAYVAVIVFHLMTWAMFNIGLFPLIMMTSTLLFFDAEAQDTFLRKAKALVIELRGKLNSSIDELVLWNSNPRLVGYSKPVPNKRHIKSFPNTNSTLPPRQEALQQTQTLKLEQDAKSFLIPVPNRRHIKDFLNTNSTFPSPKSQPLLQLNTYTTVFLTLFFICQLILPLRALAYPGPTTWSEEGYRFGWRVMLVEKVGVATFTIKDSASERRAEVNNLDFLTPYQEKQMAIQPDFILQFSQHLAKEFAQRHNFKKPIVNVESFVALNGRRSRRLIDPSTNLAAEENGLSPKPWILPFER